MSEPAAELLQRHWSPAAVSAEKGVPPALRVMQFNVLADGYSGMDPRRGGFVMCPPEALSWEYRRPRLVLEILQHGMPDVVCLQEVDHFSDFEAQLTVHGYAGLFQAKPDSGCKQSNDPTLEDGAAIFYRTAVLKLARFETLNFQQEGSNEVSNQLALIAHFGRVGLADDALPFLVCCTHLKATKSEEGEKTRTHQVSQLLARLAELRGSAPAIICCDLNATPTRGEKPYESTAYPLLTVSGEWRSAYAEVLGAEPAWTTCKRRPDKSARHAIDFIFTAGGARAARVLLPPPDESLPESLLPCAAYPSDHVALCAELLLD